VLSRNPNLDATTKDLLAYFQFGVAVTPLEPIYALLDESGTGRYLGGHTSEGNSPSRMSSALCSRLSPTLHARCAAESKS
jgi:hypothetical protein